MKHPVGQRLDLVHQVADLCLDALLWHVVLHSLAVNYLDEQDQNVLELLAHD